MGTYTESSLFSATIYRKETTDSVTAGPAGAPANLAEGQLANRTRYLYDRLQDNGIGLSANFSGNMNNLTSSGFFYIASGASNKPGTTGQGFCWVVNNGSTLCAQWYVDLSTDEVYFRRITSGPAYGDWKKLAIDSGDALDVLFLQNQIKSMLNPLGEEGTIISGCVPFNVNTGAGTLEISAGVALVGSNFVSPIAYAGDYPVYLKDDGTYTVVEPVSGDYITFDPYTSQNYVDVMRRATTRTGTISFEVTDSNLTKFTSGLGKWEYKGFALADGNNGTVNMKGFVPMPYDPGDADYNTVGETGGSKQVTLTIANLPTPPVSTSQNGLIRKSLVGENVTVASVDSTGAGIEPDVKTEPIDWPYEGASSTPVENRPPYKVVVCIQRI